MKARIHLIAAPTAIQPGGYIPGAYADRTQPAVTDLDIRIEEHGPRWEIFLSWACPVESSSTIHDVDRFADSAAILTPSQPDAALMTMGSKAAGVDGWFWKADEKQGIRFQARGLGTVERSDLPADAQVTGLWQDGRWGVKFELPVWRSLDLHRKVGFAVWQGAASERAGLKSVSPGWIELP